MSLLAVQDALPARGQPMVVAESEPVSVDRDEVLLVEEWRLRTDATAVVPGTEANETTFPTQLTANPQWTSQPDPIRRRSKAVGFHSGDLGRFDRNFLADRR